MMLQPPVLIMVFTLHNTVVQYKGVAVLWGGSTYTTLIPIDIIGLFHVKDSTIAPTENHCDNLRHVIDNPRHVLKCNQIS